MMNTPRRIALGLLAFERGVSTLGQQMGYLRDDAGTDMIA